MLTIGYHTLQDQDNVDYIENNGPIKCQTKAAWLGHGYYFWDANPNWAHKFGRSRYKDAYMIFECIFRDVDPPESDSAFRHDDPGMIVQFYTAKVMILFNHSNMLPSLVQGLGCASCAHVIPAC